MSKPKPEWQHVALEVGGTTTATTARLQVHGGWLYRVVVETDGALTGVSTTFVPGDTARIVRQYPAIVLDADPHTSRRFTVIAPDGSDMLPDSEIMTAEECRGAVLLLQRDGRITEPQAFALLGELEGL